MYGYLFLLQGIATILQAILIIILLDFFGPCPTYSTYFAYGIGGATVFCSFVTSLCYHPVIDWCCIFLFLVIVENTTQSIFLVLLYNANVRFKNESSIYRFDISKGFGQFSHNFLRNALSSNDLDSSTIHQLDDISRIWKNEYTRFKWCWTDRSCHSFFSLSLGKNTHSSTIWINSKLNSWFIFRLPLLNCLPFPSFFGISFVKYRSLPLATRYCWSSRSWVSVNYLFISGELSIFISHLHPRFCFIFR